MAQSNTASVTLNVKSVNDAPVWTSTAPTTHTLAPRTGADTIGVYRAGATLGTASGTSTRLSFDFTLRDAAYNNEIGIYRVDDASGRIGNLMPGDAGYAKAALSTERATLVFAPGRTTGAAKSIDVAAGQYFGTYLVQDATSGHWRAKNPANATNKSPVAFFSIAAANPDNGFNHVNAQWSLTNAAQGTTSLQMNWEDLTHGGDRDYNDAVITVAGLHATTAKAFVYDANATDVDGDTLTYSLGQAPAGASINAATGQLTWANPTAGTHSFTINVADGQGGTAQQVFSLTVTAPNTAPKAQAASYSVGRDGSIKIDLRNLISDAENDALTLLVSNPAKGKLTKNTDGTYTYKPNRGYTGTDSFTYTVSDGKTSTTANVTLRIGC